MYYTSFVCSYHDYITETINNYQAATTKIQLALMIVFLILSLIVDILWHYFSYRRLYSTIFNNFRVKYHPIYDGIEYEERVSNMNVFKEILKPILIHICHAVIFIAVIFLLKYDTNSVYLTMMKYNMISVRIENLSLTFTIVLHAYFRSYLFDYPWLLEQLHLKVKDFNSVILTIHDSFSPLNVHKFKKM